MRVHPARSRSSLDRRCDAPHRSRSGSVPHQLTMVLVMRGPAHGCPVRIFSQGVELLVDAGTRRAPSDALRWLAEAEPRRQHLMHRRPGGSRVHAIQLAGDRGELGH